jgi:hypothetical protein
MHCVVSLSRRLAAPHYITRYDEGLGSGRGRRIPTTMPCGVHKAEQLFGKLVFRM